jgi:hypothetical protein
VHGVWRTGSRINAPVWRIAMQSMSPIDASVAGGDRCASGLEGLPEAHHLPIGAKPGKELSSEQRLAKKSESAGTKRIKRSDKITAVDRRNEGRIAERLERLRVVPVVQMAPVLFEPRNCSQAAIGKSDKLGRGQESELAGSLAGIQQQAELVGETRAASKRPSSSTLSGMR